MLEVISKGFRGKMEVQQNELNIETFLGGHLMVSGEKGEVWIEKFYYGVLTICDNISVNIDSMNDGIIDMGSDSSLWVVNLNYGKIIALEKNTVEIDNFSMGEIDAGDDNSFLIHKRGSITLILVGERNIISIKAGKKKVSEGTRQEFWQILKNVQKEKP